MNRIVVARSRVEELSRQSYQLGQEPGDTKSLAGILMVREEERTQFDEAWLYLFTIKG